MPGPAPKPEGQRRRRNATLATTRLPAAGRSGPAPAWPLGASTPKAFESVWMSLWSSPQAVMWERLGHVRLVARYCRCLLESEKRGARTTLLAEVRQMEDRLGLSPMAMLRLRWSIDEPAASSGEPAVVTRMDDYRDLYGQPG